MFRRSFLSSCSAVSVGFLGLERLLGQESSLPAAGLGPLSPAGNLPIDLPKGFKATRVAKTGDEMEDGLIRPAKPDGMGAFPGSHPDEVLLVCNHELNYNNPALGPFGPKNERLAKYGPKRLAKLLPDGRPYLGGTTTISWNTKTRTASKQHLSLAGTDRNCAGGPTPWGSWITCEEPEHLVGPSEFFQEHGWCYEVPSAGAGNITPLKAMGRFRHEAVAVDPKTGIVYLTEDRGDGLFYRFRPDQPGKLHAGGTLEALAIRDKKQADTRNWQPKKISPIPVRKDIAVEWVPLEDTHSPKDDLRFRGLKENGAAVFARGEGIWFGDGELFFTCTNGGPKKLGQIFRYRPSQHEGTEAEAKAPGQLQLFIQPSEKKLLEGADNLTVAPWGDLVICEDGSGEQFLRGVTPEGKIYNIARVDAAQGEFAGACFAPNHPTLFVNNQKVGHTMAIEGPWPQG